MLAPLGNYGGPTQTMPELPGSPAIGAGSVALAVDPHGNPLTTDQRGLPRVTNGTVDIGAFQSQGFTFTVVPGGTPQTAAIGTAFANPLAVTVTANKPIEPVNGGVITFVAHPAANGASAIFPAPSAVITNGTAALTAAPEQHHRQLQRRRVRPGLFRLVPTDQRRHALRCPGREYDQRFHRPGPRPPEPA